VIPPVHILTVPDDEMPTGMPRTRQLTVNRADPGDSNVVISFAGRDGRRDAIGIPPIAAHDFAIAILTALREIER